MVLIIEIRALFNQEGPTVRGEDNRWHVNDWEWPLAPTANVSDLLCSSRLRSRLQLQDKPLLFFQTIKKKEFP